MRVLKPALTLLPPTIGYVPGDAKGQDHARTVLAPWRKWYSTARWRRLRMAVFVRDMFKCQLCPRVEPNTSLLVADHITAHKGDPALFWDDGNIQTLCKSCHDTLKQSEERSTRRMI